MNKLYRTTMLTAGMVALGVGQITATPSVETSRFEWVDKEGIPNVEVWRVESDTDAPRVSSAATTRANFWALRGKFPFYVCPDTATPLLGGCDTYQPPGNMTNICGEWHLKANRSWVDLECPPTRESGYTYWFGTCGGTPEQVADWPQIVWRGSCNTGWRAVNSWFLVVSSPDCRLSDEVEVTACCQLANTVTTVTTGVGYRIGDYLAPAYGVACDNVNWKYQLHVTDVNGVGGVSSFEIIPGIGYITPPPNPVGYFDIGTPTAQGFTANVTYAP